MKHREGRFTGQEGLTLYYQCWLPTTDTKAVLLLVHGFGDHGAYWAKFIDHFVARGYAVCAHDHRGHGKSEGLGGYVEEFQYYVDDLRTFVEMVRGEYGDSKVFMVGISMGGLIAATHAIDHQRDISGLLLAGALLKPESICPRALVPLLRLLSLLAPRLGLMALDFSALTQDKAVEEAVLNDPLVYKGKVRARFGAELWGAARKLKSRIPEITLPILIMHGTTDRLTDPEGSHLLYEQVGSEDKILKLYEGFYHEIFNELGREQVFADMEAWLSAHI